MLLFISSAEIFFIFFIILLVFGADKIPSFAKTLAKGIVQVKQATNEIKSEIQKTTKDNPVSEIKEKIKSEIDEAKDGFDDLTGSVKRKN
tara:strand:- start:741 stop:1010 length:270 start_codon:yes stop_codon:yes gene_type:complete